MGTSAPYQDRFDGTYVPPDRDRVDQHAPGRDLDVAGGGGAGAEGRPRRVGAAGGFHRRRRAEGRGRRRDGRHDDPVGHHDQGRRPRSRNVLELLPSDKPFEAVTQQLADAGPRAAAADRPRRDGDRPRRRWRQATRDSDRHAPRPTTAPAVTAGPHGAAGDRDRPRRDRREPARTSTRRPSCRSARSRSA